MGLYNKATSFLENSNVTPVLEGNVNRFLKGKSLLKSIVFEAKEDGEILLKSESATPDEVESKNEFLRNSLELPIELQDGISIIIHEDDEIILDISKFFSDEGVKFIEPRSSLQSEIPPVADEPEEKEQKEESELEQDNETSDYIQDIEVKLQYYNLLKDIFKELIASESINVFFDNLLYSIEGQLGPKYILIISSINELYQQYEIVSYDGIELNKNYLLTTDSAIIKSLITESNILYSKNIDSTNYQDEKEFMFQSENELLIPFILEERLIGFIVLGDNDTPESYSDQEIEFLKMLVELASSVLFRFYEQEKIQKQLNDSNISKIKIELLNTFYMQSSIYQTTEQLLTAYSELLKALEADINFAVYIQESREVYKLIYNSGLSYSLNFRNDEIFVKELRNTKTSLNLSDTEEIERLGLGNEPIIISPGIENDELYTVIIIPKEYEGLVKTDIVSNSIVVVHTQLIRLIKEKRLKDMAKNPLSLIEDILISELVEAQKKSKSFSLIIVKIQNTGRIIQSLGSDFYVAYSDFIYSVIHNNITVDDDIFRIGKSKQCLFLRGRDSVYTKDFIQDLKDKINDYSATPKDFKIISHVYSLDFPDQTVEIRKFMELLEEA